MTVDKVAQGRPQSSGPRAYNRPMNKTNLSETSFYIRRTWTTFSGTVTKVDHIGPYGEDQEFAVAMQRGHDMRRQVPATEQITKWEWVDGVTAIADVVFG